MYYILLMIAVLGIVGTFSLGKIYQQRVPPTFLCALIKNIVLSAVGALIYWVVLTGCGKMRFPPLALWCGLALAGVLLLSTVVCFFAYCKGSVGIFTVFQMAGGMLIPYVYGAICGNPLNVWNVLGLALILCGLGLSVWSQLRQIRNSKTKISRGYLLLCLAVFVLNGAISTISYYYGNHPSAPALEPFMIARTLLGVAITLPLIPVALWMQKKKGGPCMSAAPSPRKPWRAALLVGGLLITIAVIDAASYFLQVLSTPHLPAVAIYPFMTGGTIALTALAGRVFFGEKMDRPSLVGTAIIALATLLFVI